jgi:hypothetical protein
MACRTISRPALRAIERMRKKGSSSEQLRQMTRDELKGTEAYLDTLSMSINQVKARHRLLCAQVSSMGKSCRRAEEDLCVTLAAYLNDEALEDFIARQPEVSIIQEPVCVVLAYAVSELCMAVLVLGWAGAFRAE